MLGEDPAFDWQVLPEYEWCGIEAEAMAWAERRMAELRKGDAERWGGNCVSGAGRMTCSGLHFWSSTGFGYSGEFAEVNMLRGLDEPIPDAAVPDGCQVRALAEAGEISQRAAAHREVWQPWTVGNVSDEDYARFMRLPGYERDLDVVDSHGGWRDRGVCERLDRPGQPDRRFRPGGGAAGLPATRMTRAALLEGLRRMQARGMERVCVSTGVSNTPALRLYESIGFRVVNRYLDYVITD